MNEIKTTNPNGDERQQTPVNSFHGQANRNEGKPDKRGGKPRGRGRFFFYGFVAGAAVLIAVFIAAFSLGVITVLHGNPEPQKEEPRITDVFITGKLESASEVTSAKYIFSGIKQYQSGFIPFINLSKFTMFYTATVRAGIENTADIGREITDSEIILTLPAAKILDVHIHPSSVKYFEKEDPLIHPNDREQVTELLKIAEDDAKEADMSELLDLADEQLEKIITEIFEGSIGDYKLVIKHGERAETTAVDAAIDSQGDEQ